jgi:hypothetical protein
MTERLYAFEGTDGQASTTTLSGASAQVSGTWTFNTSLAKLEGSTGLRVVTTAATTTISRFSPAASSLVMSAGIAVRLDALPPKTFTTLFALRSTGSGTAVRAIWKTDGTVALRGTGTTTPEITTDAPLTIGKQYWLTMVAQTTAAGPGSATLKFYDASTRTLAATATSTTALSFGTTAFNAADIGFVNGDPVAGQGANFDSLVLNDGTTAEQFPASWSAPAALTGSVWDGTTTLPGTLRYWDGTAQSELATATVS